MHLHVKRARIQSVKLGNPKIGVGAERRLMKCPGIDPDTGPRPCQGGNLEQEDGTRNKTTVNKVPGWILTGSSLTV